VPPELVAPPLPETPPVELVVPPLPIPSSSDPEEHPTIVTTTRSSVVVFTPAPRLRIAGYLFPDAYA
jgi:hypothetical protein